MKKKVIKKKPVVKKKRKPKSKAPIQYNRQPQMWITGVPGSFRYMF